MKSSKVMTKSSSTTNPIKGEKSAHKQLKAGADLSKKYVKKEEQKKTKERLFF